MWRVEAQKRGPCFRLCAIHVLRFYVSCFAVKTGLRVPAGRCYRSALMRLVAITNRKGGVGKSTIALHLAAGLSRLGWRACVVDMDPQRTVTQWSDYAEAETRKSAEFLLRRDVFYYDADAETDKGELQRFTKALGNLSDRYACAVIDTPPATDRLVTIPARVADLACIPLTASPLDFRAAVECIAMLRAVQGSRGGRPVIGLIPSMIDRRTGHGRMLEDLLAGVGEYVGPPISRRVALVDAALSGATVFDSVRWRGSAVEFLQLARWARELLEGVDNG